jgi:beta-mannosidase
MSLTTIIHLLVAFQPLLAWTQTIIPLDGNNWSLHDSANNVSVTAVVPGYVHLDLQAANIIGDPYYGQFPRI